jgi:hypothetical protein
MDKAYEAVLGIFRELPDPRIVLILLPAQILHNPWRKRSRTVLQSNKSESWQQAGTGRNPPVVVFGGLDK